MVDMVIHRTNKGTVHKAHSKLLSFAYCLQGVVWHIG